MYCWALKSVSDVESLEWTLKIYISDKFQGDVYTTVQGFICQEPLF